MEQLLTVKQAADYLAISVSTLKRLLAANAITFIRIGRSVRFQATDLDKYITQNKRVKEL